MFGKKKTAIPVQHYEGLSDFPQDSPCTIELKDGALEIKRIKPDVTVTLPADRILSFSAVEEPRFMLKYHGEAENTSKAKGIDKYYLVVDYKTQDGQEKMLAFWGTASEYGKFIKYQSANVGSAASYTL